MAPVGYNFNATKPGYHSPNRGERKRRIIIFAVLTIVFIGILYLFLGKSAEPTIKDLKKPAVPTKVTKTTVAPVIKKTLPNRLSKKSFPKMEVLLDKAKAAYAKERYDLVRKYCYQILDSRQVPDENPLWDKTVSLLGEANTKIFFSDFTLPEKKVNSAVKPNQGLRQIAMNHNTSMEAVQRSNNMKLTDFNVQLGKTFNIYVGQWEILISKERRKLYLFDGKKLFKVYDVGIGKQNRTPTGVFKTGGKRKNPHWYSPKGKIAFGSKENVLGTRWIRLIPNGKSSRKVSGLGIHGTWEPESIGKAKSNGCLRMHNKDVEELFAILPNERKPVPVTIIK